MITQFVDLIERPPERTARLEPWLARDSQYAEFTCTTVRCGNDCMVYVSFVGAGLDQSGYYLV